MKDKGKLLALLFIGSEAFFFLTLLMTYIYFRRDTLIHDSVAPHLNVKRAAFLTICLVTSSVTFMLSKKSLFKNKIRRFKIGMFITMLLAAIFLLGQGKEYYDLYKKQITISRDIFGSNFFTLTGFHGLHVFLGLTCISLLFAFSFSKFKIVTKAGINGVEVYWHFVDGVWLFIFFYVYITPLL
ncbi:hypothetical protein C7S20_15870 [Christiangramia fulva]|uniref:Heme-copper oxidase subunit III family profile domain-containing protein n=1 Tax=Christiangramia fulva TaxID=2126553 RepID=A0A2R3Z8M1_9FLAO|nr:heme-copper oxidase subunit III [Christiangramia fulva]AVR46620.1 hypothetical protein C7S20_15870 [Christiangramia fulva]